MRAPGLLIALLAAGPCVRGTPPARPAQLPAGWAVVDAPAPESRAAWCANQAVHGEWAVTLRPDGAGPLVRRHSGWRGADTAAVPGGRLVSENRGEFGGDVWWEPAGGPRERVAETNLVAFVPTRAALLGLEGLSHMTFEYGGLVRFDWRPGGGWAMTQLADLGAAPYAFTALPGDTLLVAASGALLAAGPPGWHRVLHRNPVWRYTYPNSVVRDRAGVIYVGMRSAVARLTPAGRGYREAWLVPPGCPWGGPPGGG